MEKKKILVTGGAGLIGLEVCKQLAEAGHDVRLFDLPEQIERVTSKISSSVHIYKGSILEPTSLDDALNGCDTVVHLAAMLGVQRTENDKLRCLHINIDGTRNVLESAIRTKVQKIVFSSSSEVYGEPLTNPITEDAITQGKTVYAITKLAGEELCKAYAQRYGIKYSILRYFNCYGPYQVSQFVLAKFVNSVKKGESPNIYGDGTQVRSYTHVVDTANATVRAATTEAADGTVLNIGDGTYPISLKDLADHVIRAGGKEGTLEPKLLDFTDADRSKEREIHVRYCDSSRARELLTWQPTISLEDGIKDMFENGMFFDRWENLADEQT